MLPFEKIAVILFLTFLTVGFTVTVGAVCVIIYWDKISPGRDFVDSYIIESSRIMEKFSDYQNVPCIFLDSDKNILLVGTVSTIIPGIEEHCQVYFKDYLDPAKEHLIDPSGVIIRFRHRHLEKAVTLVDPGKTNVPVQNLGLIAQQLSRNGFYKEFGTQIFQTKS